MRKLSNIAAISSLLLFAAFALPAAAQNRATPDPPGRPSVGPAAPGVGERLGESVDRGLNNLGQKLRKGWAEIRQSVDELSVQGRVYGRLHWDKSLEKAPIEISVQDENNVTLSGTVPDEVARTTALNLAQSTSGVGKVVDHLTIASTTITTVPSVTDPATPLPEVPKR